MLLRRKNMAANPEDESGHDSRPWVYFMVDCFMLITEFFVLTFQFKTEEVILPHKLPGCTGIPSQCMTESLTVHVQHVNDVPVYQVLREPYDQTRLADCFARAVSQKKNVIVRVSYDKAVPWSDVMNVFNECSRARIQQVGLVPTHDSSESTH
ncbi:MAG: biopolymer transporter ExbD [Planctomycetes bacterium]|nr:biopolymer transporter ExbD [Planctomycetota bacterium]